MDDGRKEKRVGAAGADSAKKIASAPDAERSQAIGRRDVLGCEGHGSLRLAREKNFPAKGGLDKISPGWGVDDNRSAVGESLHRVTSIARHNGHDTRFRSLGHAVDRNFQVRPRPLRKLLPEDGNVREWMRLAQSRGSPVGIVAFGPSEVKGDPDTPARQDLLKWDFASRADSPLIRKERG